MIRYDKAYNQKIERVVSNFNRKVRRLEKEERKLIPSTVSVRDIKDKFTNRRDLNNYLRDLRRFSKRGAEDIVSVKGHEFTKYDIDVFRAQLRRERYALDKEISEEESRKSEYPMQHKIALQNMRSRRAKLERAWNTLIIGTAHKMIADYERKLETYDNYLNILFQDAYAIDYDENKISHIRERLLELSPREFIRALESEPAIQEIFNHYHSMTRQSAVLDSNEARQKFDLLYEKIDAIVEKYQ